jgi:hypothetical protein
MTFLEREIISLKMKARRERDVRELISLEDEIAWLEDHREEIDVKSTTQRFAEG